MEAAPFILGKEDLIVSLEMMIYVDSRIELLS